MYFVVDSEQLVKRIYSANNDVCSSDYRIAIGKANDDPRQWQEPLFIYDYSQSRIVAVVYNGDTLERK